MIKNLPLVVFASVVFFSTLVRAATVFPGHVTTSDARARKEPKKESAVVIQFTEGDSVQILSQYSGWYRIQLRSSDGKETTAWIEKEYVQLGSTFTPAPASKPAPTVVSSAPRPTSDEGMKMGLYGAPVLNLYRFGTTQWRGAADALFPMARGIEVGPYVSYAFGSGFSSIQGGLEGVWDFYKTDTLNLYGRGRLLFERFSGKGRSFVAATIDASSGFRYLFSPSWALNVEPISVEVSPWTTKQVPWFMRAQVLVGVEKRW